MMRVIENQWFKFVYGFGSHSDVKRFKPFDHEITLEV